MEKQNFLNLLSDSIFIFYNNKILFANDEALCLIGYKSMYDIIGKSIINGLSPHQDCINTIEKMIRKVENNEVVSKVVQKLIRKDGTALSVEISGTPYIYEEKHVIMFIVRNISENIPLVEHRGKRLDKKDVFTEAMSTPFVYNGTESILTVAHDITKRKMTEEALKESEERYVKLVELSPDAIFITNRDKFAFVNNTGAALLGASSTKELIGQDFLRFYHSDCYDKIKERSNNLYTKEKNLPLVEAKMIKLDGTVIDVEISSTDLNYNGERTILNITRDITERKKADENKRQLEEAIQFDKLKTEFFSNISHELKTPLNIILASIQLINAIHRDIEKCQIYDRSNKYIGTMKQNCFRLLRLINNLIDITKLDAGFLNMKFGNYNIISVVEDITLSILEYTQSKGITLLFDTDVEEKITAFDLDKIERVMLNLLSNAIKFTDENGNIYVNIYDKDDRIIILIRDTGIGIPENMIDKIFDRFRQVESSLTLNQGGSGIGLSLVKSIVEAHGGTITAKSKYGVGSEFTIELPIRLVNQDSDVKQESIPFERQKVEKISIEFSDIYS
ncbi:sensor histidine kinase [Clostridium aciditolerans]|uniref:histidine kinase n=1 Tax=Clostridium aciditolerans TaxID=339861 RepID=A0A934HX29_9CLOT|nr:PAS domain S-box protein [Clostridium aciditolerans]MBI6875825.1 PAS domain S-box protein [Clostridium aciditolerans]